MTDQPSRPTDDALKAMWHERACREDVCARLHAGLGQGGYPVERLTPPYTVLTSQQACHAEAGGNWYHFFK